MTDKRDQRYVRAVLAQVTVRGLDEGGLRVDLAFGHVKPVSASLYRAFMVVEDRMVDHLDAEAPQGLGPLFGLIGDTCTAVVREAGEVRFEFASGRHLVIGSGNILTA